MAAALGVLDKKWVEEYEQQLSRRMESGGNTENEAYRALNALLTKHAGDRSVKITVDGISPVDGYFIVEGKKYRNPPFYEGDRRIVKECL